MSLLECFDRYGCDKGSAKHRYDRAYEPVLQHLRDEPITILEIGVLRGASIAAWLDYFPKASVIGVDTFERVAASQVAILKHPRVSWWKCDSTREAPAVSDIDVIVDDGDHIQAAQVATFRNFMPLLKRDGVYFIEDVLPFDEKLPPGLRMRYPENSAWGYRQLLKALEPYRTRGHDLRDDKHPVSYLIEVRHA